MQTFHRLSGLFIAFALFVPALAAAQATTTASTTIDVEIQSLLSQISSLQLQLRSLLQSAIPNTTPPMWGHASSTEPSWDASSTPPGIAKNPAGNCSVFSRNLSEGSEGDDVTQLQQMLQGDGFLAASSTGFFGPMTAHALGEFQMHFGISSSSTGFFGPLTRGFFQNHCDNGEDHGHMGSSTPGMMGPMRPAGEGGDWQNGSSTAMWGSEDGQGLFHGMMGSSTVQQPPCPNGQDQGSPDNLFVPHAILPPCGGGEGEGHGGGPSGPQH